MKRFAAASLAAVAALAVGACRSGDMAGNAARLGLGGAGAGRAGDIVAAGVTGLVDVQQQMSVKFSPEQEYFLGRGVAANLIAEHHLDTDESVQQYVRTIGATLVTLAPRIRATHGGWRFAVLASPQVNGASGPGGFVMVTRGALDAAESEDEVAGLLAHEIAHVSLDHGESVVRSESDFQEGMGALGRVVGAAAGDGQFQARMYSVFRMTASGLAKRLFTIGYGAELETKADREAVYILYQAGYDAGALAKYLRRTAKVNAAWTAHPDNAGRAAALDSVVATWGGHHDPAGVAPRAARFAAAMHHAAVAQAK